LNNHQDPGNSKGKKFLPIDTPRRGLIKDAEQESLTAAQFPHQSALPPTHGLRPHDGHTYGTAHEIPLSTSLAQNVGSI
jgi:hypothetical protein